MIDSHRYNISLALSDEDGEQLFKATVKELPDIAVYETTAVEAYNSAISIITDLQISFKAKGKSFPEPHQAAEEASGRTTLRMSKSMHQRVTDVAREDDISLNQWIVEAVAWRLRGEKAGMIVNAPNAISVTCNAGTSSPSSEGSSISLNTMGGRKLLLTTHTFFDNAALESV